MPQVPTLVFWLVYGPSAGLVDQHASPPAGPRVNGKAAGFGSPIESRDSRRGGMQLWVHQCQRGSCWLWQPH